MSNQKIIILVVAIIVFVIIIVIIMKSSKKTITTQSATSVQQSNIFDSLFGFLTPKNNTNTGVNYNTGASGGGNGQWDVLLLQVSQSC